MSFWYTAHDDELLIDLDDYNRPTRRINVSWGESFFRRRLRDAIVSGKLGVLEVWLIPSTTENHFHAIIKLDKHTVSSFVVPPLDQLVWQMYLGSDIYRSRADLMRAIRGFAAPSLLIMNDKIPEFYREPDRVCPCKTKHITSDLMAMPESQRCKVWNKLRGMSPWELFGESTRDNEVTVNLVIGRVPMSDIMARLKKG